MTQPPDDPTARDAIPDAPPGAAADASPTEPVPLVAAPPPAFAFTPAEPEPGPGGASAQPPTKPATTASRSDGSRVLAVFLGAAVLVGAVGLAFAAGRASAPAPDTAAVSRGEDLSRDRGRDEDGGAQRGGNLPDDPLDLDGNGFGRRGDRGGGFVPGMPPGGGADPGTLPGSGLGREGFGGATITGTVEAVDADSLTISTGSGLTITVGLDGTTTYHQADDAQASDVAVGQTVEISVSGRFRARGAADDELTLGTASDVTIVP